MKFVHIHTQDAGYVVGIEREFGRIERVLVTVVDGEAGCTQARRAAHALTACDDLSDGTLALMAKGGGTRYGSLGERVTMTALLWGENGRLAEHLLDRARKEIKKHGGKI